MIDTEVVVVLISDPADAVSRQIFGRCGALLGAGSGRVACLVGVHSGLGEDSQCIIVLRKIAGGIHHRNQLSWRNRWILCLIGAETFSWERRGAG